MKTKKQTIRITQNDEPFFKEIEAKVFTINGIELALNPKSEPFEFTHVKSGLGFNGDQSRTIKGIEKSLQALEKRMGKRKAWGPLKNCKKSIDDHIAERKQTVLDNKRKKANLKKLNQILGFTPPIDGLLTSISGKITLDVIKLNSRLSYKFDLTNKSIKQVLTENYSKECAEMVEEMI